MERQDPTDLTGPRRAVGGRAASTAVLALDLALLGYALVLGSSIESTSRAVQDAETAAYLRLPALVGVVGSVAGLAGGRRWWGVVGLTVGALGAVACVVVLAVR